MVTDNETNKLYLSDVLSKQQPDFFDRFIKILDECKIKHSILRHTKDIWAVDYMPIQIENNRFIQFVYNPDYLQSQKWLKTISDVDKICKTIGIRPIKSKILLDGGNVIRTTDKVIMCDKIFLENSNFTRKQLIKELQELFQVEQLIFVPQQPKDYTGHSDGMIRFLDSETVIINAYLNEKSHFTRAFYIALHNANLNYVEIPYDPHAKSSQANGYYINYLQMEDVIIMPTFGTKYDEMAFRQFEQLFYGQKIATIDCNEIANKGGVLNCITWNIQTN
jgi:agmatine deiminase